MTDKTAATVNYLLDNAPQAIKQRGRGLVANFLRYHNNRWVYDVGGYIVRIKVPKISVITQRQLTDRQLDRLKKIKNRDLMVSCPCKFWRWNGPDFNADQDGYSERSFSNLSEPVERDPQHENLICKHVYAALKQFSEDYPRIE